MEKYKDGSLSVNERVEDLLSRMTTDEKIAQMQCAMVMGDPSEIASAFPDGIGGVVSFAIAQDPMGMVQTNSAVIGAFGANRLGIPPLVHVEAVTGLVSPGGTVFPSAIGLGATFNPDTIQAMADTIRRQMVAIGYRQALSPVMDVARDPRWGRIGETYGEDPTLCAAMSVAYTKGLQGDTLRDGAIATGKHFLGYGFSDGGLNMASNPIPRRELREAYAKPFQAAITEGKMQGIMNAYGTLDGEMIIASKQILTGLLRDEMMFDGLLVSDYMSVDRLVNYKLTENLASAGAAALNAGLDMECPMPKGYTAALKQSLSEGKITLEDINRAARRVLTAKFRLGLFENAMPRAEGLADAYGDPVHALRSLKAAREAVVMLKNDGVLPLKKDLKTIAVVGPHADSIRLLFGCYTLPAGIEMQMSNSMAGDMAGMDGMENFSPQGGAPAPEPETYPGSDVVREQASVTAMINAAFGPMTPTILESIKAKCPGTEVIYARGCDFAGDDRSMFSEALEAAKKADAVIVTMGGKYGWGANCTIGEGIDRDDIGLTGIQEELAKEIAGLGKPLVMVHMDARPLSSVFIRENFNAVLENWFPGITGGAAIADVLFGDYNPAGRLPATAARNAGQIPVFSGQKNGNSYYAKNTVGALNKYCEGTTEPLFYFGEGLSYTTFEYSGLTVTPQAAPDATVEAALTVKNTGGVDGEEVVQLYVADDIASMLRPAMEFAGCKRVFIKKGESVKLRFTMRADQFAFINKDMDWIVEQGSMRVMAGASSRDIRLSAAFDITKTAKINAATRGFFARAEVL